VLNVLAFGAHPDDVELFCAGTLIKMSRQGHKTAIADLTAGELGSRGNAETRKKEAEEAARLLGLSFRENLGLRDGHVADDEASRKLVVEAIRRHKPQIVLAPFNLDRHPDHEAASRLVTSAHFFSGVHGYKTESPAYRPPALVYYFHHHVEKPSFIIDISDCFEAKMQAIRAYKSQFHDPQSKEPQTYISRPEFLQSVEIRARHFGFQIGVEYAEPFFVKSAIKIDNLLHIVA